MAVNVYGSTELPVAISQTTSQKRQEIYGLSFPLGAKKTTGGIFAKASGISMIKGAVKQLLNTKKGERVMHPAFGVDLESYLFEPLDEDTFEDIKQEILFAFNRYIVGAQITKLSVVPADPGSVAGGNGLIVTLTLRLSEDYLKVFDVEVLIS